MPVFEQHLAVAARGIRAFLNLEAGVGRAGAAAPEDGQGRELERARRELASKDRELARLRARLARDGAEDGARGVRPENIVWIFGTGRSGNTWLSSMMGELEGHAVWSEPSVGRLFGEFYYLHSHEKQRGTRNFVLGEKQKGTWLRSIRNFVLEGAGGRFPEIRDGYLVIKEQVGSVGAPLLMEALPESRMILLVRDPRDVAASGLDAARRGGWQYERRSKSDPNWSPVADEDPIAFARETAKHYLKNVGKAKEAYDSHQGHKVLVKYEDLRLDTPDTMKHIYASLGIPVDEGELARAVEKHSWEKVPEDKKGEGKFYRKASPGGWREDLTPEQAEMVEEITAPLLKDFYPHEGQSENSLRSRR